MEARRGWTTGNLAYLAHVDSDREWCDLASLVWVETEHRSGDRVATDTRCFISSLLPKAQSLLQAVRGHWSIENAHHEGWMLPLARTASSARDTPPITGPSQAHRAQPAAAGPVPRVGMAHKRLAAAWNQDCLCRLIGLKPKPVWMQYRLGFRAHWITAGTGITIWLRIRRVSVLPNQTALTTAGPDR